SFTINGDVALVDSSTLSFEIGGLVPGTSHDFVDVNSTNSPGPHGGHVQLDGDLVLTFAHGFETQVSSAAVITIMTSDLPITGAFDNVGTGQRVQTSDNLGSFRVSYGASSAFNPNNLVLSDFRAPGQGEPVSAPATVWTAAALLSAAVFWRRRHLRSADG